MPTEKTSRSDRKPRLYIGSFTFDSTIDGEEREGMFQLIVCAGSPNDAEVAFRARLKELRAKYEILENLSAAYLDGVAEVPLPLRACVHVDYRVMFPMKDGIATIGNTAPEQGLELGAYGFGKAATERERAATKPFVRFAAKKNKKPLPRT